ncbi:MAG: 4Fe-4S dicluster domain-containing protein [Saccharofermentans sp.]|nr:4Fe-4S dicluster domain-containing protein [Saccharofermentans sp.]
MKVFDEGGAMSSSGLPVLYKRKEECCGCTACASVCPQGIIKMVADSEGFEYPVVDECAGECLSCYKCIRVCPMKG